MARPSDFRQIGWLYFIQSESQNAVKIGFASDVDVRVKSLQSGNPADLTLLAYVRATYGAEMALHRLLRPRRLRLEWYPDDGLIWSLMTDLQDESLDRAMEWLVMNHPHSTDPQLIELAHNVDEIALDAPLVLEIARQAIREAEDAATDIEA